MRKLFLLFSALLLAAAAAPAAVAPDLLEYARKFEQFPATKGQGSESERLQKLFDLSWDFVMHASPEFATYIGYPGPQRPLVRLLRGIPRVRPHRRPEDPGGPGVRRPRRSSRPPSRSTTTSPAAGWSGRSRVRSSMAST